MPTEITASDTKYTRLAGLLFLVWILTGLFSMLFLPSKIHMNRDAGTIAQEILSNEVIFRISMITDLISSTVWILLALTFYKIFKPVHNHFAKLLVAFVIVQIPMIFITEAFKLTSVLLLHRELLKSFSITQQQELAIFLLRINEYIVTSLVLFWGLWLLPLGYLVYKSKFLPNFLGIWLLMNGGAYMLLSFISLVFPSYKDSLFNFIAPFFFGEVVLMLWLLIKGTNKNKTVAPVSVFPT